MSKERQNSDSQYFGDLPTTNVSYLLQSFKVQRDQDIIVHYANIVILVIHKSSVNLLLAILLHQI